MPEPTFHLQSLALAIVVAAVVTFLCLVPALLRFAREFRHAMRAWVVGTALVVSTDVLFFLGVELTHADTVLTAIAGLGIAEWLHALHLYVGRTRRVVWPYLAIAAATVVSLASPTYPMSVLVTSTLFAILYVGAAVSAARISEPESSVGKILLVAVFLLVAAVMVARLGLFVSGVRSGAPAGFTSTPRAVMFILASIAPIAASFAFVISCGERLGARLLTWSLTDSLTGVPNRRAFDESLVRALSSSRRRDERVAMLVVDLDHFKRVNDEAGHAAGDQALIEIGARLAAEARAEDTIGRLGGEEFGVVMPGMDRDTAMGAAERLRSTIADRPVDVHGRAFHLTASIGVTVSHEFDESPANMMARADEALYAAKSAGRDRVESR